MMQSKAEQVLPTDHIELRFGKLFTMSSIAGANSQKLGFAVWILVHVLFLVAVALFLSSCQSTNHELQRTPILNTAFEWSDPRVYPPYR